MTDWRHARPLVCPWCSNMGPHEAWCRWDGSLAAALWRFDGAWSEFTTAFMEAYLRTPFGRFSRWLIERLNERLR